MNFRDVELLSAYLDGRLSPSDSARLEKRLASERSLKAQLDELQLTMTVLRRLPQRRAPRNFRLTPKMAGIRPPEPRAYPIFRVATALATFLFVAAVALNGLAPIAASRLAAAPAPAYGMGGGGGGAGGGGPEEPSESAPAAPAATEAPLQPFAAAAPTATAEIAEATEAAESNIAPTLTQDSARNQLTPTPEAFKAAPAGGAAAGRQPVVPLPWVVVFGILMIASAGAAWFVRLNNERHIRERWNRK